LRNQQDGGPRPRICMPTARLFKRMVFQSALYEAQDVLAEVDEVELLDLVATDRFRRFQPLQRKLLWHDVTDRLALLNPGLAPVRLTESYDALILVCQNWWDLLHLNAISGWQSKCGTTLCYVDELYAADLAAYRHWLPALARFDHVVLGMRGSLAAVERAIGKRCHYVPVGIDALRFTPHPNPPPRVVDVYSIGRRWPRMHESLLSYASTTGSFYVFDAMVGVADVSTTCHVEYRRALANVAKRSRHFVVGPAKLAVDETCGQQELGYRFFEGAAAGAVMIGQAPDCAAFKELFGWPDSVVPLKPDGSDVVETLESLRAQPDRLEEMSRRNAREALLRHDWVYRWMQILAIAGLEPTPRMSARVDRLRALAGLIPGAD